MSVWIHNLPIPWLTVVVFGATYLGVGVIHLVVMALAKGERARWFKAFSPGMLSPLGILFGLLIAFVASQVWSDFDRANTAVHREASSLRTVMLLTGAFPSEYDGYLQALVRRHIQDAVTQEWASMASHHASLKMMSGPLVEALHATLELTPRGDRQAVAQRELITALQNALDARRQRIILSGAEVTWIKWTGLLMVAATTLVAIAFVHGDNWKTAALAMGVFATAVATVVVLILSHDSPFTGPIAVSPAVLLQVLPEAR